MRQCLWHYLTVDTNFLPKYWDPDLGIQNGSWPANTNLVQQVAILKAADIVQGGEEQLQLCLIQPSLIYIQQCTITLYVLRADIVQGGEKQLQLCLIQPSLI